MQTRTLGQTNLTVSPLGFGGASLVDATPESAQKTLNLALDSGITLIDTAQIYGRSEELIGLSISHRRSQFTLISKCGHHEVLPDGSWRSLKISMTDIDSALTKLKTDHLDVMLLHSYDLAPLLQGDALAVLEKAKKAGKILHAGYSGDNETALIAATLPEIAVIETSINFVDQYNTQYFLPLAQKRNLGVLVKRSIGNAVWQWQNQTTAPNPHFQEYLNRLNAMNITPASLGLPETPWGEIALRFTLSLPAVTTALVGTANPQKLAQNIAWASKGPLPQPTVTALQNAFKSAEKSSKTLWKGCN